MKNFVFDIIPACCSLFRITDCILFNPYGQFLQCKSEEKIKGCKQKCKIMRHISTGDKRNHYIYLLKNGPMSRKTSDEVIDL